MKHSFLYDLNIIYLVSGLFVLMFAIIFAGYKIGLRKVNADTDNSTLLSALLALMGLLLAFTFGMSGSRYDERRNYIIAESNSIGTAILRADLYPDSISKKIRNDFRTYLDARIAFLEAGRNEEKVNSALKHATLASKDLWQTATEHSFSETYRTASLMMIPALNEVFDSASMVNESFHVTVPDSIIVLLLIFSAVSSFFIGYTCGIKKRFDKLLITGFCLLTCVVIYIILDLDRPRRGLIHNSPQIHLLKELKEGL